MPTDDSHALGYRHVDGDANVDVLLETMDETALWEATVQLRAWERDQLRLTPSQRLLDVGCGRGDAALALAQDLGSRGEVVGVDVSSEMIASARRRARDASCRATFRVGDALGLVEPDNSFDAVRSERTLQWLADPGAAVSEMTRVLRPGGRLCLIDTDWSTLTIDVADGDLSRRISESFRVERRRPSNIGRRLGELVSDAGLEVVDRTSATQHWTAWNPDESPAPIGCFSMASLAEDLVATGQLGEDEKDWFVSTVHTAARDGRFSMALTMCGVSGLARVP